MGIYHLTWKTALFVPESSVFYWLIVWKAIPFHRNEVLKFNSLVSWDCLIVDI